MQYFEWYLPNDGKLWQHLKEDADHLKEIGITDVWLPPMYKATSTFDVGYGTYDYFDLGEFDQKGDIRTKYGTKKELLEAIKTLQSKDMKVIADVVLNHKANGDGKETFSVMKMDPNNRQEPLSEEYDIEGWTYFDFPGRQNKYNEMKWHWYHFSGTDYDASNEETGVYMILGDGKGWADNENVSSEKGNFDYLMFNDIDFNHPEVRQNIYNWADWFLETTQVDGFRLDAAKHIDVSFMNEFIQYIDDHTPEHFYIFAEYWSSNLEELLNYLDQIKDRYDLVDVPLHMNFSTASHMGDSYDMRHIFDQSLLKENPTSAVTFVENHDSQQGQALESFVEPWFKPLAYALILLREQGMPCVFYGDYYGIQGEFEQEGQKEQLDPLLYARMHHAYGEQIDYFDHANCIGWTRLGNDDHSGLAVLMSNGEEGWKEMSLGELNGGKVYFDLTGQREEEVVLNDEGVGQFYTNGRSVSVWIQKED